MSNKPYCIQRARHNTLTNPPKRLLRRKSSGLSPQNKKKKHLRVEIVRKEAILSHYIFFFKYWPDHCKLTTGEKNSSPNHSQISDKLKAVTFVTQNAMRSFWPTLSAQGTPIHKFMHRVSMLNTWSNEATSVAWKPTSQPQPFHSMQALQIDNTVRLYEGPACLLMMARFSPLFLL